MKESMFPRVLCLLCYQSALKKAMHGENLVSFLMAFPALLFKPWVCCCSFYLASKTAIWFPLFLNITIILFRRKLLIKSLRLTSSWILNALRSTDLLLVKHLYLPRSSSALLSYTLLLQSNPGGGRAWVSTQRRRYYCCFFLFSSRLITK